MIEWWNQWFKNSPLAGGQKKDTRIRERKFRILLKGIKVTFFVFFAERIGITQDARGEKIIVNKFECMCGNKFQVKQGPPVTSQYPFDPQEEAKQAVDVSMPGQNRSEIGPFRRRLKQPGNLYAQEQDGPFQNFRNNFQSWMRVLNRIGQVCEGKRVPEGIKSVLESVAVGWLAAAAAR